MGNPFGVWKQRAVNVRLLAVDHDKTVAGERLKIAMKTFLESLWIGWDIKRFVGSYIEGNANAGMSVTLWQDVNISSGWKEFTKAFQHKEKKFWCRVVFDYWKCFPQMKSFVAELGFAHDLLIMTFLTPSTSTHMYQHAYIHVYGIH